MQEKLIQQITEIVLKEIKTEKNNDIILNRTRKKAHEQERNNNCSLKKGKSLEIVSEQHETNNINSIDIENSHNDARPVEINLPTDSNDDRILTENGVFSQYTPARVAVGRAGPRPRTSSMLKFRFDHASAVDAVYGEVSQEILDRLDLFTVETKVKEKEHYIRRPDLGRRLTDEAKKIIKEKCKHAPTVQIVASNGLSASAVNANLEDVYLSLKQSLDNLNIDIGTSFYAHQGRVALMDDIGEVLKPEVVVILIGERPGLVTAESLSAYLCYRPNHETIESDRMVISNIHKGGISPIEAGAYIATVIQRILKHKASGVNLIQKEG